MTLLPLARAFTVAACALAVGALACEPRPAAAECEPSSRSLDAPTALVLSGGGAKGAYEAGVAATLVERGEALPAPERQALARSVYEQSLEISARVSKVSARG